MQCQIYKRNHYITVNHRSETLDRTELEYGYSQLMDHALQQHYNVAICDFSSIKRITASENDVIEIIHALSLIFAKKPDFHFIVVAPTPQLRAIADQVRSELNHILDSPDVRMVSELAEATQMAESLA